MIVEPDFPDHWKTKLLVQLTDDAAAPMMLIRLWCHCHARKMCRFEDLTDEALAAICQWKNKPSAWRDALIKSGFLVSEEDGTLYVHDWDIINAKLVANWKNGKETKRRREGATSKPEQSHRQANDKPSASHGGSDGLDGGIGRDGTDGKLTNWDFSEHKPKGIKPVLVFGAFLRITEDESQKFFRHNERRHWGAMTERSADEPLLGWRRLMELWKQRLEERSSAKLRRAKNLNGGEAPFDPTKPHAHTGGLQIV
jgi:hypothetical protein